MIAGEWFLRGFVDACNARAALVPEGPAGEQYGRGYSQGLAAVQRDFFAAIGLAAVQMERAEV
jgi:hypothetical protein